MKQLIAMTATLVMFLVAVFAIRDYKMEQQQQEQVVKDWEEVESYHMQGLYTPSTKVLVTEDSNGRLDTWDDAEISWLTGAIDRESDKPIEVWVEVYTLGTKDISDDQPYVEASLTIGQGYDWESDVYDMYGDVTINDDGTVTVDEEMCNRFKK